jgi:hypothetical protein
VPKTCPNVVIADVSRNNLKFVQELEECYNLKYQNLGLEGKIQKIRCENNESPYSVNTFDYLFGYVYASFGYPGNACQQKICIW